MPYLVILLGFGILMYTMYLRQNTGGGGGGGPSRFGHGRTRTLAAQAADELLNIKGILTSFVLYPDGERVVISARSIGEANVQVILEPLGGGGNAATAGAQIPDKSVREVLTELVASIDKFYEG